MVRAEFWKVSGNYMLVSFVVSKLLEDTRSRRGGEGGGGGLEEDCRIFIQWYPIL